MTESFGVSHRQLRKWYAQEIDRAQRDLCQFLRAQTAWETYLQFRRSPDRGLAIDRLLKTCGRQPGGPWA